MVVLCEKSSDRQSDISGSGYCDIQWGWRWQLVSVKIALKVTLEKNGKINGPKKLEVFGASYLYPMFLRFGLIQRGN